MRRDTHAGSWYSDDAASLESDIEDAISKAAVSTRRNLKYIISPHAGYSYCIYTAAFSYGAIELCNIKTAFILGPSHYESIRGCGVDHSKALKTPFGPLTVDTDIVNELRELDGFVEIGMDESEQEHSIEMQLPILKYIIDRSSAKDVKVVPIMVGSLGRGNLEKAGEALLPYFQREDTLFIISSDFCHYGRRFGFVHTGYEDSKLKLWEQIKQLDLDGVEHIIKHDLDGFISYLNETENTICGRHPIEVLLKLIVLSGMKLESRMLSYTQSGKCKGAQDSSVSYCAIVGELK